MVRMVNAASNRCGTALAWVLKASKAKTMLDSTKEKKRDLQFSGLSRWKYKTPISSLNYFRFGGIAEV